MTVGQNTVTIRDVDFTETGAIDAGGNFIVNARNLRLDIGDGVICSGGLDYSGRIQSSASNGNIVGSLNCNGITFSVAGTHESTRSVGKVGLSNAADSLKSTGAF